MKVTKWLKPTVGGRSQSVPECLLNKCLSAIRCNLVDDVCWPVLPVHGSTRDRSCLAWERQVTARNRTNRLILYQKNSKFGSRPLSVIHAEKLYDLDALKPVI
jgi:hypothetical protein